MPSKSAHSSLHVINVLIKSKQEKRLLVYFKGITGSGKTMALWLGILVENGWKRGS
jgi:Tfp pilus assembly pilus retraction ATPase PilT